MKAYPTLTIIFPTYNGWKDTKDCLASIRNLNYPKEKLEVIVVDNASTDGTPEKFAGPAQKMLKEENNGSEPAHLNSRKLTIKLLINQVNLGFAKAVNLGAKEANSEIILITNNDVTFEKNCLQELLRALGDDPKIGVVGGKVYGKNQDRICIQGFRLNPYLGYHQFDLSGLNRKRECDWISGNCFLVRRKLFLDFGGFDKEYFFYFEDIDFCLRARKAGFKLLYTPEAIAYHGYAQTIFKEKLERIFYLGYRSRWRCLFKNASPPQIFTSSIFLLIFSPFYQSLKTHHNVFKPMLKGLLPNLKRK